MAIMRPPLTEQQKRVMRPEELMSHEETGPEMDFGVDFPSGYSEQQSQWMDSVDDPNQVDMPEHTFVQKSPKDNELDIGNINNLMSMYAKDLMSQRTRDNERYDRVQSQLAKQSGFDLTPEQYQQVMEQAHGARAIANIFQATNLGGNGAAFKNIGDSNYDSALTPIKKAEYFKDLIRKKAKEDMELGTMQRQNLKEYGSDIENLLGASKNYSGIKIDRDKNDPNSNISVMKGMQVLQKLNAYNNEIPDTENEREYLDFKTKTIPEFKKRIGVDAEGKLTGGYLTYNQLENMDKEIDATYKRAKDRVGQDISRSMAGASWHRAATGAEPKPEEMKMVKDLNNLELGLKNLDEVAKLKMDTKTGQMEAASQQVLEFLGLPGRANFEDLKSSIGRIVNKDTKEVAGTGVSGSEWSRILKTMPQESDSDQLFMIKLNGLVKEMKGILSSRVKDYEAYKAGGIIDLNRYKKLTEETKKPDKKLSKRDEDALDWANSNPNDPRSAAIKKKLGVQ